MSDTVQVAFTPGGKRYHCLCPGARIGDIVVPHGWSGRATVVGHGCLSNQYPPTKRAEIVQRAATEIVQRAATTADAAVLTAQLHEYHFAAYTKDPVTMPTGTAVEQITAQLKAAKKAEKRARAVAREKKRIAADRARLRSTALDALARVAEHGDDDGRTAAAAALLHYLDAR